MAPLPIGGLGASLVPRKGGGGGGSSSSGSFSSPSSSSYGLSSYFPSTYIGELDDRDNHSDNENIIAGSVIGGVFGLFALIAVLWCLYDTYCSKSGRKARKEKKQQLNLEKAHRKIDHRSWSDPKHKTAINMISTPLPAHLPAYSASIH